MEDSSSRHEDDSNGGVLEIVTHESPVVPAVSPQPLSPGASASPVTPEVKPKMVSMETPSPIIPSIKSTPSRLVFYGQAQIIVGLT